jgi:hypothetical protein
MSLSSRPLPANRLVIGRRRTPLGPALAPNRAAKMLAALLLAGLTLLPAAFTMATWRPRAS